ncbi:MAG: D-glucuronyl C5-epimerase family protein [Candidatus Neomarinimicrobiota bacterium]
MGFGDMSLYKKYYMLHKLIWDIKRGDNFYPIGADFRSTELGEYYFVFDEGRVRHGKDQALITDFDENGIPLNSTYIDVAEKRLIYFPISIGQLGLAVYHSYLHSGQTVDLQRFLKFADWFVDNADLDDKLGVRWFTNVELPAYRNLGPWQSAFAQGRGISILLRAYQETKNEQYAEYAQKALISFLYEPRDGGVTSRTKWGPFYEEYTAAIPTLVFNGHIFSLFGLIDFNRVFPDHERCRELVNQGYATILNCIPDFDLGYWTRYNYCQAEFYPLIDPATLNYQRLHVLLLKTMNKFRYSESLDNYIRRWHKQINPFNYIKASLVKYQALKKLNRI